MHRIALVYSFHPSDWVSCQKIVRNLAKAYSFIDEAKSIVDIEYTQDMSAFDLLRSAEKLSLFKPTHVVCIDHKPHPLPILETFFANFIGIVPKLIFHTFGDFNLNLNSWHKLEKVLIEKSVLFYGASERQTSLLSEFIDKSKLATCPFPISEEEFVFSDRVRNRTRELCKWKDEHIFLFTGRLSRQKQILELITTFTLWLKSSHAKARLVLVGDFDEVGDPYTDRGEWIGEYFHETMAFHESLEEEYKNRIEFHGFKNNEDLLDYYCAADTFVNISVHNDEDYGMSCAEALSTGLPLILTDWAGFSSFASKGLEEFITYIPVSITSNGRITDLEALKSSFDHSTNKNFETNRQLIADCSLKYTGVRAVSMRLQESLAHDSFFESYSDFFIKAANREEHFNKNTFYNHRLRRYNEIYMRIYSHYVRTT